METDMVLLPEQREALRLAYQKIRAQFPAPPALKVSDWAKANRILPKGTSNRPGRWVSEPFQDAMMDALLTDGVREVICKKSTQIGWSDGILNNIVGFFIDHDPRPILLVQPSEGDAKGYSRKRISPMIASCPALRSKARENISRKGGNTLLLKEFDGGFLKLTGAQTGKGLRGDPIAVLLLDEMDGLSADQRPQSIKAIRRNPGRIVLYN